MPADRPPRAVILGCAGPRLGDAERRFFAEAEPLGFILFARNVETPAQLRRLVGDLRACVGRADAPVLIDQEGGRVQRLRPPHWRQAPPAAAFGRLARRDSGRAAEAAALNARLLAADLRALGIDVDCAPVLDVPARDGHDVIGDRAFGSDPADVARLGRAVCDGLLAGGVQPVIKHLPGHGRARADSHLELPVVDAPAAALREVDLPPFRALRDAAWGMTAHVVYSAWDAERPATTSARVIDAVIRGEIGFEGALLSDDLSMKALSGDLGDRAAACLAAGCDVALHCNGEMAEMRAVVAAAPRLDDAALERVARARGMAARAPEEFDVSAAEARLAALLAEVEA